MPASSTVTFATNDKVRLISSWGCFSCPVRELSCDPVIIVLSPHSPVSIIILLSSSVIFIICSHNLWAWFVGQVLSWQILLNSAFDWVWLVDIPKYHRVDYDLRLWYFPFELAVLSIPRLSSFWVRLLLTSRIQTVRESNLTTFLTHSWQIYFLKIIKSTELAIFGATVRCRSGKLSYTRKYRVWSWPWCGPSCVKPSMKHVFICDSISGSGFVSCGRSE